MKQITITMLIFRVLILAFGMLFFEQRRCGSLEGTIGEKGTHLMSIKYIEHFFEEVHLEHTFIISFIRFCCESRSFFNCNSLYISLSSTTNITQTLYWGDQPTSAPLHWTFAFSHAHLSNFQCFLTFTLVVER